MREWHTRLRKRSRRHARALSLIGQHFWFRKMEAAWYFCSISKGFLLQEIIKAFTGDFFFNLIDNLECLIRSNSFYWGIAHLIIVNNHNKWNQHWLRVLVRYFLVLPLLFSSINVIFHCYVEKLFWHSGRNETTATKLFLCPSKTLSCRQFFWEGSPSNFIYFIWDDVTLSKFYSNIKTNLL